MSQEPNLFSGTISFNIRFGARAGQHINQDKIQETCQACNIHEFIMDLPDGYQTECGHNACKLGGGQKQRIAVARAMIRDPDIFLLDETTASLNSPSEKQVQQVTCAARRKRTTIVVAHRLSSVQKADNIFVFDMGLYARMVRARSLT